MTAAQYLYEGRGLDTAVALLEHYRRPGQIEVHQPMAEEVQIEALGGDVGTEQHAERVVLLAEALDDLLLLEVREAAVEDDEGVGLEAEIARKLRQQPFQGLER